jgi:hypothetical protein
MSFRNFLESQRGVSEVRDHGVTQSVKSYFVIEALRPDFTRGRSSLGVVAEAFTKIWLCVSQKLRLNGCQNLSQR